MKRIIFLSAFILLAPTLIYAQTIFPNRGGTGTTTIPTTGQVLVAQPNGTYGPQATSTLGISGGSSTGLATTSIDTESELESILTDVTNVFTNNDGSLSDDDLSNNTTSDLLEGTNLYYTVARIQSALTAGYNSIFGNSTTSNATTTNLAVTNSFNFLGTVITNVSTWFNGLWDSQFATKTTDNLTEGTTNKYNKISTSTMPTNGHLSYWTSGNTLGSIATGTLTETVSGLQFDNTRGLVGGSAILSLTSGFGIPSTTDFTNWNTAFSWGNHASQGYLSTTSGNWAGTFDGLEGTSFLARANHTGTQLASTISDFVATVRTSISETITGIVYNNGTGVFSLDAGYEIPKTASTTNWESAFGWGNHATQGYIATTSGNWTGTVDGNNFAGGAIGSGDMLYGSGAGSISELGIGASSTILVSNGSTPFWITGPSICSVITGGSALCDGDDATGAGGGITTLNGLTNSTQSFAVGTSSNVGIHVVSSGSTHTFTPTVASGYGIPLTASTTEWANFYATPSTRITAGTGLSWSGNTINALGGSGSNWTIETNGLSTATTTDYAKANYFIATGTTATSTFAGAVGIGTTTPLSILTVQGTANVTSNFQVNGGTLFVDATNNRVGIGTTTPVDQMSIVSSAVRTPYISFFDHLGNRAIDIISATSSTASSTAFGLESLKAVTTATGLTAFGSGALRANTTGNNNTAVGAWALKGATTGGNNTAFGFETLQALTSGTNNTAFGTTALRQTSTASRNIGIGHQALYANTTGASNIAIGNSSARYLADGATTNIGATSSIYIGHDIRSGSTGGGALNEIVIGNYLTGNGTNTATFGDSSLSTLFAGKVGIGTTTPTVPLSVENSAFIGGSLTLLRALKDSTNATGTSNQLLTSTGTSTLWQSGPALCVSITGSADLCDGDDATGGAGSYSTSTADYLIWKVGSVTYGINGDTGTTIATSTDIGSVMRSILTYATATKGVNGGIIHIKPGQYTSSATTTIYGNSTNYNPMWIVEGAGASTTNITVTGGSFLNFTNMAEVQVRNMSLNLQGNVNGFSAVGSTTDVRSVWNSQFENLKLYSSDTSHTGYAFHFGNDFRNIYTNIELFDVANGLKTYTQGSAFNIGDSVYERWFCELYNTTTGVCFNLDGTAGGDINQSSFVDVNGISDGGGTNTFIKMTEAFHNTFTGLNAESFATTTQLVSGRNNTLEFEYVIPSTTGNYFFTGTNAYNNSIGCRYIDNPTGAHVLWDDDSNVRGQHNILQGVGGANCVLQGAGTYSFSTTSASIIREIHDNITGAGSAALFDELKVLGDRIVFDFQTAGTSFMKLVSSIWTLTISGIDVLSFSSTGVKISDDADGAITFTGQSAGNDESLTWNYDDGTANTVGVSSASGVTVIDWGTVGADYDSVSITLSTLLGAIDAGGATSFEVPNGTAPTINATGTIGFDTTDNQLVVGTSTTAAVVRTIDRIGGFSISSTTYPFAGFVTGKAIPFVMERDGYVVTEIHCDIDGGTSIVVNFDNGSGNTSTVTCDTDGASVTGLSSNNVVTAGSASTTIETGTVTGSPDVMRVSVFGYWTRE